jgi:hypothetical protein
LIKAQASIDVTVAIVTRVARKRESGWPIAPAAARRRGLNASQVDRRELGSSVIWHGLTFFAGLNWREVRDPFADCRKRQQSLRASVSFSRKVNPADVARQQYKSAPLLGDSKIATVDRLRSNRTAQAL